VEDVDRVAPLSSPSRGAVVSRLVAVFLRAALPSILLGVATKALLFAGAAVFDSSHAGDQFAADLASRVSWSVIVCEGLGLGTAAIKSRFPAMGLAGLISAPIAFNVSRGARKGMSGFLEAIQAAGSPSPVALALGKGFEYGCLGIALAWLGGHSKRRPLSYVAVGLTTGIVFGGVIFALNVAAAPSALAASAVFAWAINELLFPIGCSLVIFTAELREG